VKKGAVLFAGLLSLSLLLAAACGGDGDDKEPTATPTTSPAAQAAAAAAAAAQPPTPAADVSLTISAVGDELKFDKDKLTVKAGQLVSLTLENPSEVWQHNWVLVKKGKDEEGRFYRDAVAADGLLAGEWGDFIPLPQSQVPGRMINYEGKPINVPLVKAGQRTIVFQAPEAGTYEFVCTFTAHSATMFGDFVVTE